MVSVGDIQTPDRFKCSFDAAYDRRVRHYPQAVPNAVFGGEVIGRRQRRHCGSQVGDVFVAPIYQKHRAGLRAAAEDMVDPVLFLVRTGQFMLADNAGFVFFNCAGRGNPGLDIIPHLLLVHIVTGRFVSQQ